MTRICLITSALITFTAACANAQQPEPSPRPSETTVRTITFHSEPVPSRSWVGYGSQMTSYSGRWTSPVVTEVTPDSPASRAGLAVGDTLVSVDGESQRPGWSNLRVFGTPGQTYRVRFRRDGREHEVLLTPEPPRPEP